MPSQSPPQQTSRRVTFFVWLTIACFLLVPDLIFGQLHSTYLVKASSSNVLIALLLAALITLSRARLLGLVLLTVFFLMQATQLAHYRSFGVFYSGVDIARMFKELADTSDAIIDLGQFLLLPFLLSALCYCLAMLAYAKYKTRTVSLPYVSALTLVLLCVPLMQALGSKASQKFQPNVTTLALKNGHYSVSFFVARQLKLWTGTTAAFREYKPYALSPVPTEKPNIVVLMGESTSYLNMGVFGYTRQTTPDLQPYLQHPNFILARGISSAVSTRVSLALFYNLIYEPDNPKALGAMQHSLYRLAKQQGYATAYISTQKNAGGLTYSFSANAIDIWKDSNALAVYPGQYDNRLLLALRDLSLPDDKAHFITLHMLSAHTPYIDNYPRDAAIYPDTGQNQHDYIVNSYDNAIHYTQKLIADIYAYFDARKQPVYIFFVPDHGEAMGQNGRYGHNTVQLESALVPILVYGSNVPASTMAPLKERLGCLTNHYLVGKEIAALMGYRVDNPNEVADTYYLNGTGAFGEAGYLPYSLHEQRQLRCPHETAAAH